MIKVKTQKVTEVYKKCVNNSVDYFSLETSIYFGLERSAGLYVYTYVFRSNEITWVGFSPFYFQTESSSVDEQNSPLPL